MPPSSRRFYPDIEELDCSLLDDPDEAPSPEATHWFGDHGEFDSEALCPCSPRVYWIVLDDRLEAYLRTQGRPVIEVIPALQHNPYIDLSHRKSYVSRNRGHT